MSNQSSYYKNLPIKGHDIRLVRVLPTLYSGRLQCEMKTANIEDEYTALSYTWGSPRHRKCIYLNGQEVMIGRNLWELLRTARCNYNCWLWIDAICINQQDIEERNRQVQNMAGIYRGANETLIWLGDPLLDDGESQGITTDTYTVVDICDLDSLTLHHMDSCTELRQSSKPNSTVAQFLVQSLKVLVFSCFQYSRLKEYTEVGKLSVILDRIIVHPYWSRLWVVQEIVLSPNKTILSLTHRIKWTNFTNAASYICNRGDFINMYRSRFTASAFDMLSRRTLWDSPPWCEWLQRILMNIYSQARDLERQRFAIEVGISTACTKTPDSYLGFLAKIVCQILSPFSIALEMKHVQEHCFDNTTVHQLIWPLSSWLDDSVSNWVVLHRFENSKCSDRRDHIFALIGFCQFLASVPVDYNHDIYDLYFTACAAYANESDAIPGQRFRQLLCTLHIGPLDLLCGDIKQRTSIIHLRRLERSLVRPLHEFDKVAKGQAWTVAEWYYYCHSCYSCPSDHIHMHGLCQSCNELVCFETFESAPESELSRYGLVQCHKNSTSLSRVKHVLMHLEAREFRLMSYQPIWPLVSRSTGDCADVLDCLQSLDSKTTEKTPFQSPDKLTGGRNSEILAALVGLHEDHLNEIKDRPRKTKPHLLNLTKTMSRSPETYGQEQCVEAILSTLELEEVAAKQLVKLLKSDMFSLGPELPGLCSTSELSQV